MKVGKLSFKMLEIDGKASIATDLCDGDVRGIYAYEFTDGTWYVGKSTDVRTRHVQHMHEYRHRAWSGGPSVHRRPSPRQATRRCQHRVQGRVLRKRPVR